jgi:hypothetical protein
VQRSKSQYRVFFSDGYGLWLTDGQPAVPGTSAPVLFPNPVFCVDEAENSTLGAEVTYFGSSDGLGYVYQMDVGTSFDGAAISAYLTTAWNPMRQPAHPEAVSAPRRWRCRAPPGRAISFGYQLGYGSTLIGQPTPVVTTASGCSPTAAVGRLHLGQLYLGRPGADSDRRRHDRHCRERAVRRSARTRTTSRPTR